MKIIVTGANGNVGRLLVQMLITRGHEPIGVDIDNLDITDHAAVRRFVEQESPALIIHAAAMTHVDRCAEQPDEALRINAGGTKNIALACQRIGAALCYISTNEVFDGTATAPYLEYDKTGPINPYGYSKWVGENIVREVLPQHYIVRTSWLFAHTGQNFLQKIVALAKAGKPLSVVTDETASPTYTDDFVAAVADLTQTQQYGTFHLVNEGAVSRFEFARAILDFHGLPDYPITPITSADFKRASRPPAYAPLKNFFAAQIGIQLRAWDKAVAAFAEIDQKKAVVIPQPDNA
jgi:dTDP-4-dehydrorhamnose reductase